MRFLIGLVSMFVLLQAACSQPAPVATASAPKPDLAADEKAIRDLDARWLKVVQAKDAAGEAALFASDGVYDSEHMEPLVGPAAYQAYSAKNYSENPKSNVTWATEKIQIAEAGDIAIQTGSAHVTGLGPKGDREDKRRFITVWKKVNGEWKVAHDIDWTTMPEPPTPPK